MELRILKDLGANIYFGLGVRDPLQKRGRIEEVLGPKLKGGSWAAPKKKRKHGPEGRGKLPACLPTHYIILKV